MKIISWNVNGIRAVIKKGFLEFVESEKPDIICIQETKARPEQVELELSDYNYKYWNSAEKKGYSGTSIFSKFEPLSVSWAILQLPAKKISSLKSSSELIFLPV